MLNVEWCAGLMTSRISRGGISTYSRLTASRHDLQEATALNMVSCLSECHVPGRSGRVIEVLSRLISERGAPRSLRSDNGPEFVSTALLKWAARESLDQALIEPGKSWQNGLNESFNGKFRDECLSMEWFRCRAEARVVIEEWRRHYELRSPAFKPEQHDARTFLSAVWKKHEPWGNPQELSGPKFPGRSRTCCNA